MNFITHCIIFFQLLPGHAPGETIPRYNVLVSGTFPGVTLQFLVELVKHCGKVVMSVGEALSFGSSL